MPIRDWRPLCAFLCCLPAWPQTELRPSTYGGEVRINQSDLAVLETPENRSDLDCDVSPLKPVLAFDLRFHAGYRVRIPLQELAGSGNELRLLLRVTPRDRPDRTYYLRDRFTVPPVEDGSKGEAMLPGAFTLGPGRYRVDWLMRDLGGRVCSAHWDLEAEAPHDDPGPLAMPPGTVAQRPADPFRHQPPVARVDATEALHAKFLVNFSPTDPGESTLKHWDVEAILAILRNLAREPRIGRFSVVAFNIQEERVIYRADNTSHIDFPALGEAVGALELGTIDYRRLKDPHSATRFLTSLLIEQLGPQQPEPDAIIIVGPKLMLDKNVSHDALREAGRTDCPVFYLNYNSNPRRNPRRDAIGHVLRIYKGLEYSITLPRDMGAALTDMMSRLRKDD